MLFGQQSKKTGDWGKNSILEEKKTIPGRRGMIELQYWVKVTYIIQVTLS